MHKSNSHFKIVAGLGNPGEEYRNTYHNIGYNAIDFLSSAACRENVPHQWKKPSGKHFIFLKCGGIAWIKPTTFMNESGNGIKEALSFFDAIPKELVVIHDENDIPIRLFKISAGKGAAGHRGIVSIIHSLGTKEFTRIRIGIQRKDRKKAGSFVLSRIRKNELKLFHSVFAAAIKKLREKE